MVPSPNVTALSPPPSPLPTARDATLVSTRVHAPLPRLFPLAFVSRSHSFPFPDRCSVSKVLISLCSLLHDPNPKDPLVHSIAKQLTTDKEAHDKRAREWVKRYAKG